MTIMPIAMTKGKYFLGVFMLLLLSYSCKKNTFDEYERPDWLAGKVYTQVKAEENLSTFAKCLELTGYNDVINTSGSYTVFAPTNEAFQEYFNQNSKYKSVEDIPADELLSLVKYHIVQNPWSRDQLRSLDVNGWIDPEDEYNDKPRGYKRETLLMEKDHKYGVKTILGDRDQLIIVDTLQSSWNRKVITNSRKYAPIFYQEYFGIYNLRLSDYSFYFDRPFDNSDDIYYVNSKILGDEIFAENGFVYKVDRVVEPLPNAYEVLSDKDNAYDYSEFLSLVEEFPSFSYNEQKTFDQAGADQGLKVDSLFDLTFPDLTFDITSEKTKAPISGGSFSNDVTIRFHHGLIAPTNQAFDEFVQQYVAGSDQWGSLKDMPQRVKKIIANAYFSINPIYESDIENGFYNGEEDVVTLDPGTIVQKIYGSNCTFLGVNKAVVPRAFKSIAGPVYRQPGYYTIMNAIEYSGLLSVLKKEEGEKMLFVESDANLRLDSSLFYINRKIDNITYEGFYGYELVRPRKRHDYSVEELRILLMNQIAVEQPKGIAKKEFLKTMAGNYLIWDNEHTTVQGSDFSKFGLKGSEVVTVKPRQISTDTDNGNTYQADSWFGFTINTIYSKISASFSMFDSLLTKAGLALPKESRYNFLSSNKIYTIFAPTNQALEAIQADTLTGTNLENFLKLHFIQDEIIFTDGKLSPGYYTTTCTLPIAGTSRSENVKIYIEPGIDEITIKAKNGSNFLTVEESNVTNLVTAKNLNPPGEVTEFPNITSTGVIHQINKAFQLNMLDVK